MHNENIYEVIPSAKRLMNSLRDLGYTFSSAVSDLIDNSIQAGATIINIDIDFKGIKSTIRIADNGYGMTKPQLQEAMRYGSDNDYHLEKSLGKFGLGMKTASLSQCARFSVATRSINDRQRIIHCYSWDLAHIMKTNKWEIVEADSKTRDFVSVEYLKKSNGTVVLWQNLDRIIDHTEDNDKADDIILKMLREVEQHISMVFHRFISGEVPGRHIKIYINDNEIAGWDPFARDEKNTKTFALVNIPVTAKDKTGTVSIQPYVLPNQESFSTTKGFNNASGPRKWNQQQGFYIYRSDRLIQSGGWSRFRTSDEHTKLARIAVNFSPYFDEIFKVNVAKMKVQIPKQIREELGGIVKDIIKEAKKRYSKSGDGKGKGGSGSSETGSINPKAKNLFNKILNPGLLDIIMKELEQISNDDEKKIIRKLFKKLKTKFYNKR